MQQLQQMLEEADLEGEGAGEVGEWPGSVIAVSGTLYLASAIGTLCGSALSPAPVHLVHSLICLHVRARAVAERT
jgi:hypothetical protein